MTISETTTKPEYKWIIDEDRIGPSQELVILIPRMFRDDTDKDDWYFWLAGKKAVPVNRVFHTPQTAVSAAIEINRKRIRDLENENRRLLAWCASLTKSDGERDQNVQR